MWRSAAYKRFIASMNIGYEQWHDGIPYDLAALAEIKPGEQRDLERVLIPRKDNDWRDSEALAALGTPAAIAALEASARGPNREVRIRASERLRDMGRLASLDEVIIEGLKHGELGAGLAQAERLAAAHPTEAVKRALLEGALNSRDGRAVRFVGILYYLHGLTDETFAWKERPFFLKFNSQDPAERRALFDELCTRIGVDGSGLI